MRCSSGMHWHFLRSFPKENNIKPSPANLLVNKMVLWTLVGSLRSCPFSAPIKVLDNVILVLTWLEHSFLFLIPHPPIIFPNLSRALTLSPSGFLKVILVVKNYSLNPSCSTGICRSLHTSCWLGQLRLFVITAYMRLLPVVTECHRLRVNNRISLDSVLETGKPKNMVRVSRESLCAES